MLNQIIEDKEFGRTIIQVIDINYFDNKYFKLIVQMIKEYYQKYEHVPNFDTIEQLSKSEIQQELGLKIILDTLKKIKEAPIEGTLFVQEKGSLSFVSNKNYRK